MKSILSSHSLNRRVGYRSRLCVVVFGVTLLIAAEGSATKPCPPTPCYESNGALKENECRNAADWIFSGTIVAIEPAKEAHPLNKDFAHFSVRVEVWEKGDLKNEIIRLDIEWCSPQLTKKNGQTVRVYGKSDHRGEHILGLE